MRHCAASWAVGYPATCHLRSLGMTDEQSPGSAEQRLADAGIPLEEEDFGREDEPDVCGCLLAGTVTGGTRVKAVIRPGLSSWQRETFAEWTESRFARLLEHGPEPDGWQKRSCGVDSPSCRFFDDPADANDRAEVLAAIRICPMAVTKSAPWLSRRVLRFSGVASLASCLTPTRRGSLMLPCAPPSRADRPFLQAG
jgi:hypothetical protein